MSGWETSYATLHIKVDARGLAVLTMTRADKHNAMSAQMIADLQTATDRLGCADDVRVVVLAAEGASFSAGGDLEWMKAQFAAPRDQRMNEARKLAMMLKALNEFPKPLIGRVHGPAYGGGMGLIAVCDVAIAAQDARFGFTETRLGIIPATIGPYVLARMGEGHARRVFMSARLFDAQEAQTLGLVAKVVAGGDLDVAVEAEVRPYLSAAPGAVARAKELARALGPRIDDAIIEETIVRLADAWDSAEGQEGIRAFFDKTRPRWIKPHA